MASQAEIEAMKQQVESLTKEVASMRSWVDLEIDAFNRKIEEVNKQDMAFVRELETFQERLRLFSEKNDRRNVEVQACNTSIHAWKQDAEGHMASVNAYSSGLRELQQRIDAVNAKVMYYNEICNDPSYSDDYKRELKEQIQQESKAAEDFDQQLEEESLRLQSQEKVLMERTQALNQEKQRLAQELDELDREREAFLKDRERNAKLGEEIDRERKLCAEEEKSIQRVLDQITLKEAEIAKLLESIKSAENSTSPEDFLVSEGQFTFDAEGIERVGHSLHSRAPHVPPGESSGITIGRGFDVGQWSGDQVYKFLTAAGMLEKDARVYQRAAGLRGDDARSYRATNEKALVGISSSVQKTLFQHVYAALRDEVIRICNKAEVVEKYGTTDWDSLDQRMRDILVDLRFRGDYSKKAREFLQAHVVKNNLAAFAMEISKASNWPFVPSDRFERRKNYISVRSMAFAATSNAAPQISLVARPAKRAIASCVDVGPLSAQQESFHFARARGPFLLPKKLALESMLRTTAIFTRVPADAAASSSSSSNVTQLLQPGLGRDESNQPRF